MGDVFLAATVNNLDSAVWTPTVKAWLNGYVSTELRDERKRYFWALYFLTLKRSKYLFAKGNDSSFPHTKAAVCWSTVTELNICCHQIGCDQIWYSGALPISRWQNHSQELKFNRLVGPMWTKQIYSTVPGDKVRYFFSTSRRFIRYRIDVA